MKFCPLRSRDGPFVFVAFNEAVDMAHLQLYPGLFVPAVSLVFKVEIKKPLLQFAAVISIKMRPVLDAVRFQPFIFRGGTHKTLEVAARMQTLAAPVGR